MDDPVVPAAGDPEVTVCLAVNPPLFSSPLAPGLSVWRVLCRLPDECNFSCSVLRVQQLLQRYQAPSVLQLLAQTQI